MIIERSKCRETPPEQGRLALSGYWRPVGSFAERSQLGKAGTRAGRSWRSPLAGVPISSSCQSQDFFRAEGPLGRGRWRFPERSQFEKLSAEGTMAGVLTKRSQFRMSAE